VMDGKNTEDIYSLAELTKTYPVSVRFIEEMPFNGEGVHYPKLAWDHTKILSVLKEGFPAIQKKKDPPHSTAYHYAIPGHLGDLGIIAAFSRTFCGTCNRIRVTALGELKTCLYDHGVLNIRDSIRLGRSDAELSAQLQTAFANRPKDGFVAEQSRPNKLPVHESMSTIGG
jgi:molybdenum cofactor biosynthesis enzyme MoaA